MPKYILETIETINGYYEIEADTLEEAKAIALSDQLQDYTIEYVDGETYWNEDDMYEFEDGGSNG